VADVQGHTSLLTTSALMPIHSPRATNAQLKNPNAPTARANTPAGHDPALPQRLF